ncbi:VOC family protein [Roseobacter sp. SK209-2-6]|uniref:VOC family protein n=1 Tax=Roseobacter sp. SK209-2-6 TaxID=388739 RepID=UPI000681667C
MRQLCLRPAFSHISLTAHNLDLLSEFYQNALGYRVKRAKRYVGGSAVSQGNGLPDVGFHSVWLGFNESQDVSLEILQFDRSKRTEAPRVNQTGLGHVAFSVEDLDQTLTAILAAGGSKQGEPVNLGSEKSPCLCVYMRDPEGNLIELEQT